MTSYIACNDRLSLCTPAGTLPPSWGALTRLKMLNAEDNLLRGPLPDAWSGMAALEELGLGMNALTGMSWDPGLCCMTCPCPGACIGHVA